MSRQSTVDGRPGRPGHLPALIGERPVDASEVRLGVVAARWHHDLIERLLDRIVTAAGDHGASVLRPVRVPGAGELPLAAQLLARTGTVDAVVAAAVVIRGGTPHFQTVLQRASSGLLRVSLDESIPVADAVVAVLDAEQASVRLGGPGSTEDKGAAAAVAAIELVLLRRSLTGARLAAGGPSGSGAVGTPPAVVAGGAASGPGAHT